MELSSVSIGVSARIKKFPQKTAFDSSLKAKKTLLQMSKSPGLSRAEAFIAEDHVSTLASTIPLEGFILLASIEI